MGASERVRVGRGDVLGRGGGRPPGGVAVVASERVRVGRGDVLGRSNVQPPGDASVGARERVPVGRGDVGRLRLPLPPVLGRSRVPGCLKSTRRGRRPKRGRDRDRKSEREQTDKDDYTDDAAAGIEGTRTNDARRRRPRAPLKNRTHQSPKKILRSPSRVTPPPGFPPVRTPPLPCVPRTISAPPRRTSRARRPPPPR